MRWFWTRFNRKDVSIMGKIYEKIQDERTNRALDEVLTMLETVQGTPGAAEETRRITEHFCDLLAKNTDLPSDEPGGWNFSREKAAPVFAEGNGLLLRPCHADDARFYNAVHRQWSPFGRNYPPEETMLPALRQELTNDNAFFCVVQRRADGAEMGYVALKDTTRAVWEVAMEFDRQFCYQGYGGRALQLFVRQVGIVTGRTQFQALVEVDNAACQHCLRKIGAKFVGLYNYAFEDEAAAEEFETENLALIGDQLYTLAAQLGVEPRKLLSHVLEYRLTVGNP
jgi:RimJ/RimL family protein N-acetyltransferase